MGVVLAGLVADFIGAPTMLPFAETQQLILRGIEDGDIERMAAFMDDPRVQRTSGPDAVVPKRAQLEQWLLGVLEATLITCIIEAKEPLGPEDHDRWVGHVELYFEPGMQENRDANLGIALEPRWWGRGFGTEATQWIVNYAFEQLALHRISLTVSADHTPAVELYKRIGFKQEVTWREYFWQDGKWNSAVMMGILANEWSAAQTGARAVDETAREPAEGCNVLRISRLA